MKIDRHHGVQIEQIDRLDGLVAFVHGIRARPDRPGRLSLCSSGPIGRLVPDDVIGMIRYLRDHTPATTT